MSSLTETVNVHVAIKEKKPRKPRVDAVPVTEHSDNVNADKKTKQKNTKKNSEPVVTEPVVTEPVVTEPVITEPVVTEPVITEPVVTEPVVTDKKARTPTLPAKFNKFLQFGYYLAQSLKDTEGNVAINSVDDLIMRLHLFDTVDNQQSFVQGFFDQSKDINKSIRKIIADKKKADAKAFKLANKPTKKNNNSNNLDPLVSDIVSLANPNPKPKPKRKYNKKHISNIDSNINSNTDELDVEIFVFDGKNFLIDANKRVFDFNTHLLIGFIDHNNLISLY